MREKKRWERGGKSHGYFCASVFQPEVCLRINRPEIAKANEAPNSIGPLFQTRREVDGRTEWKRFSLTHDSNRYSPDLHRSEGDGEEKSTGCWPGEVDAIIQALPRDTDDLAGWANDSAVGSERHM